MSSWTLQRGHIHSKDWKQAQGVASSQIPTKQPYTPIIEDKFSSIPSSSTNHSSSPTIFSKEILLDSYEDFNTRLTRFQENNSDAIITFIVPSINRATLHFTLASLLNQTVQQWKAIILFDGCIPNKDVTKVMDANDRFLYLSVQKLGEHSNGVRGHGSAGLVRNIGMTLATTPWIGFVDDDDMLTPNYVASLKEELTLTPTCEFVIFRMIVQGTILPPARCPSIGPGAVGISFCMKRSLFEKERVQFQQSQVEDYQLIKRVYDTKHKMVLSSRVCYLVRTFQQVNERELTRFVIH